MKKLLTSTFVIAAYTAMCIGVWPQAGADEKAADMWTKSQELVETAAPQTGTLALRTGSGETPEEEISPAISAVPKSAHITEPAPTPAAELEVTVTKPAETEVSTLPISQNIASVTTDPYHTDVYPENVYSKKYEYDAEGNLIGKTTTYPTVFGPDTIWIDGKAYGDIPGFGLVEWGGPSSVTEDYTMYENGNKVGIMGGEDDASVHTASPTQQVDCPEPTGEVIDQTITEAPEHSSTPPGYKPDTTPPADPDARIVP